MNNVKYLIAGMYFGIVLIKSEVISWFRIQEMFRFQGFHMYGVLGLAIAVGIISVLIMKRKGGRTLEDEDIILKDKSYHHGLVIGGLLFGLGWAFTGACPGPIYALFGSGYWVFAVVLLSAISGVWVYGLVKSKLPH